MESNILAFTVSSNTTHQEVHSLCLPYGNIREVRIENKGRALASAVVHFSQQEAAAAALYKLHGCRFTGMNLWPRYIEKSWGDDE